MTKVDFKASREEAENEGLIGASYLKLKEGDNRIRLVSECIKHPGMFNGKPTFKWLCLVIDRKDGKVKPFFMANTIYKQIEALQVSQDYPFDEVPMPYDITVNAKGAGTKDVDYTVMPARANVALTAEEQVAVKEAGTVYEVQKALKEQDAEAA